MIKEGNTYHMFGDGQGILILSSTDLRNWTSNQFVFPNSPPAWTTSTVPNFTGYFWAPDIVYTNGQYYLYYAASEWGTIESAIGLVTTPTLDSTSPNYLWTDQGPIIASLGTTSGPYNCIDPAPLVDTNGTMWLLFGSYSNGIYVTQLDPTTGKRLNTTSTRIANNGPSFFTSTEEAGFIYKYNGYYYLFVNFGGCCSGVDSTYNLRVGRSTSVTGPYLDRNGVNMLNGGGTTVLESTGRYLGPGHAGILNDNGTYWFTYHYYDANSNGAPVLSINPLTWTADNWPTVTTDWSALYPFDVDAREHMGLTTALSKVAQPLSLSRDVARC